MFTMFENKINLKKIDIYSLVLVIIGFAADRFSKEYDYLKQELGIGKYKRKSIPHTLGEALPEISDKMEQEMLKENLGLKDYTND